MKAIQHYLVCIFLLISGCGGTYFTEKQSQELSRSVYATADSFEHARLDLTDKYISQTTRLVVPPKERIPIQAVHKKSSTSVTGSSTSTNTSSQRVLVVPEKFKNDQVIIVGSSEYTQLLKDKETYMQIAQDNANLQKHVQEVDKRLQENDLVNNLMIKQIASLKEQLKDKELTISQKNSTIFKLWTSLITLVVGFGVCVWLRIKGIL